MFWLARFAVTWQHSASVACPTLLSQMKTNCVSKDQLELSYRRHCSIGAGSSIMALSAGKRGGPCTHKLALGSTGTSRREPASLDAHRTAQNEIACVDRGYSATTHNTDGLLCEPWLDLTRYELQQGRDNWKWIRRATPGCLENALAR